MVFICVCHSVSIKYSSYSTTFASKWDCGWNQNKGQCLCYDECGYSVSCKWTKCYRCLLLFCLVALVQQIAFPSDWVVTFVTFLLSFVVIASLYGLGFLFASFSFVFTKISSITSLLAYGILFLVGFQEQSSHLIATLTRFLPFHLLVSFIRQPSWFVLLLLLGYGLIYWLLGYLCFQTCLTYAKKKGSLFHV